MTTRHLPTDSTATDDLELETDKRETPAIGLGPRYNALRHGITSATLLLRAEERAAYDDHLHSLKQHHLPGTDAELSLVQRIADHLWQIHRACVCQLNVMACTEALQLDAPWDSPTGEVDPKQHLDTLAKAGRTLNNYILYENRLRKKVAEEEAELAALQAPRKAAYEMEIQRHLRLKAEWEEEQRQAAAEAAAKAAEAARIPVQTQENLVFSATPAAGRAAEPPQPQASA